MSRQYTDSAKVFISIVYLTMIGIVVLVAFLLYSPKMMSQFILYRRTMPA